MSSFNLIPFNNFKTLKFRYTDYIDEIERDIEDHRRKISQLTKDLNLSENSGACAKRLE